MTSVGTIKAAPSSPATKWVFPQPQGWLRSSLSLSTDWWSHNAVSHNVTISATPPLAMFLSTSTPNECGSDGDVKDLLKVVLSQRWTLNVRLGADAPCCCLALRFRHWTLSILRQLDQHLHKRQQFYSRLKKPEFKEAQLGGFWGFNGFVF